MCATPYKAEWKKHVPQFKSRDANYGLDFAVVEIMKRQGGADKMKEAVLKCIPGATDCAWTITEGYNKAVEVQKSALHSFAGTAAQAEVKVSLQWLMNMHTGEAPQKGHCMSQFLQE
eukprot:6477555-Amphidinium_carterae.1